MQPKPDIAAAPTTPRVLLFGHPGSGKSSLLGALLQASDTQPQQLGAEVVDPSRRLALIRDHVYTGSDFQNTRTEIVDYLIELHTAEFVVPPEPPAPFVLLDCDGAAAVSLMRHLEPLSERTVSGTVAAAVVRSDAIALVVDAAADDRELRKHFDEFLMFLEQVQGRKAFFHEVGGFPIFLVLAKCDDLVDEGDTRAAWEAKAARRREHVLKQFADFLEDEHAADDDETDSPYLPFGSVELQGFAVAVRRPELDDDPHPPDEPYGVAEFFRACFAAARAHRERAIASDRRLKWTTISALSAVLAMLVGVVLVVVFQPASADPELASRVRAYELHERPAAVRLAEKNRLQSKQALTAFQAEAGFFALPEDLQAFVTGRLKEIEDYQAYRAKLAAAPVPAEARTLEELDRTEAALNTELALPPEYSWADTEAGQLREKWLADVPPVRQAESAWSEWYRGLASRATALTYTRNFEGGWRADVTALLADAERPPFSPSDPIPGSRSVPQPRGEPVTYRVPSEFDRVYQARRDWDFNRARLVHLRDLADALGLTPDADGAPRRVLDLPDFNPGTDSATLPPARLKQLQAKFPRPSADYPKLESDGPLYPEWELRNFPDPIRGLLANRVRESFRNGVRHAQRLILAKFGNPPDDTADGWRKVADSLGEPAFRDWGRLLQLLARLEDATAADPVSELATFLRSREYGIDLKGFELAIPLELRVPPVVPNGAVVITLTPKVGALVVRSFKQTGEGVQQGLVMRYTFRPEGDGKFTYHPGDGLKIEAPVRSGDQKFTLVWNAGGTETFQFDRLGREPRLTRDAGPAEPATGVRLTPSGDSTVPRVPVLLPEVRR